MRYVFIFNPVAGKKNPYELYFSQIEQYCSEHSLQYCCFLTEYVGHAAQIAREQAQKGDAVRIYGFGGDGTLCELANGVKGFPNAELGIFPCGSGNDYVRTFGGEKMFLNIDRQINGVSRLVDMIQSERMLSINLCSLGMDAAVALNMVKFKKVPFVSGSMAYNLALIKCVLSKLGNDLDVVIDDTKHFCGKYMFALAASGQYYGGGYCGAPQAVPDDGLLDFVMIKKMGRLKIASILGIYKAGEHLHSDEFKEFLQVERGKKIHIKSQDTAVVNFDGECKPLKEITFQVVPKAVRFIVPQPAEA